MLAVTGGKGGTGKTTTTLGVARALGAAGTAAIAVDADWDLPDLGALAGGERRVAYPDRSEGRSPLAATVPDGEARGVRVLPAPTDSREHDLRGTLRAIAADAPRGASVLVDCPAGAAPDAVAPLRVADGALLVTEPCVAALRDAAKTAAVARRLGTPVVGAVVTRAAAVPPGLTDLLGCPVVARIARETREDAVTGGPLASERVAAAYERAAETLWVSESADNSSPGP
ncbi:MinD/ParA family ATP-binding protein [Halobaculum gomorrense]|uniref:Septum site-determining protein MinD n=1 Tax=Halobaculum gomorrense TaxID=43928 RepID=A0A1M5RKH2_9EURY|nr:division plane positioning ATPase MipZ [Halobaculum gomorrense]SHH26754.1 septum site-determining protein MinD [Halobaculum gomorrense]